MPICKHEDFLIKTNHHKNLLGIDHGSKLIGIAISNKELFIATPLTTIVRKKQNVDFNEILKIIKEKDTINKTLKLANQYGEEAKQIMEGFENNPIRDALIDLVDFSLIIFEFNLTRNVRRNV